MLVVPENQAIRRFSKQYEQINGYYNQLWLWVAIVALSVAERSCGTEHFALSTPDACKGRLGKYLIESDYETIRISSDKFDDENRTGDNKSLSF